MDRCCLRTQAVLKFSKMTIRIRMNLQKLQMKRLTKTFKVNLANNFRNIRLKTREFVFLVQKRRAIPTSHQTKCVKIMRTLIQSAILKVSMKLLPNLTPRPKIMLKSRHKKKTVVQKYTMKKLILKQSEPTARPQLTIIEIQEQFFRLNLKLCILNLLSSQ